MTCWCSRLVCSFIVVFQIFQGRSLFLFSPHSCSRSLVFLCSVLPDLPASMYPFLLLFIYLPASSYLSIAFQFSQAWSSPSFSSLTHIPAQSCFPSRCLPDLPASIYPFILLSRLSSSLNLFHLSVSSRWSRLDLLPFFSSLTHCSTVLFSLSFPSWCSSFNLPFIFCSPAYLPASLISVLSPSRSSRLDIPLFFLNSSFQHCLFPSRCLPDPPAGFYPYV